MSPFTSRVIPVYESTLLSVLVDWWNRGRPIPVHVLKPRLVIRNTLRVGFEPVQYQCVRHPRWIFVIRGTAVTSREMKLPSTRNPLPRPSLIQQSLRRRYLGKIIARSPAPPE
ncbi:hypothetical protein PM082_002310 [Marasmius tenuissimus]|nr:hypothetical protein PM082_002310 [Marasmius tenuissimus]